MGVLTVKVVKASNLRDEDFLGKTDPYVKISLEQDNFLRDVDYGFQKTSTKEGALNPEWDEDFTFNIPTLDNMVLKLEVMDEDMGSRDDKAGWCKIKLEHEGISADPKNIVETIDFNLMSRNGTIEVEVSYEEE